LVLVLLHKKVSQALILIQLSITRNDQVVFLLQTRTEQVASVGKEVETLTNNKKELEKKLRNRPVTFLHWDYEFQFCYTLISDLKVSSHLIRSA